MGFVAPWMLLGLAALAVPIIIHLMDRSRSAPVDWPTVRFLLAAAQHSAQRSRLKHLLVLCLRLLLLALLVAATARPYVQREQWARPPGLPTTLVIVLDNSYSMGYRTDGREQTRFDLARILALKQVENLSLTDEVALILAHDNAQLLTPRPTRDHRQVAQLIRSAPLSLRGTDYNAVLPSAFALAQLDALPEGKTDDQELLTQRNARSAWRQVILISDMQQTAWLKVLQGDLINKISQPLPVTVIDVGGEQSSNRFIRQVAVSKQSSGSALNIDVTLGRVGSAGRVSDQAQLTLWINDQQRGSPMLIGDSRHMTLTTELAGGTYRCLLRMDEDRLPIDDRAYFAIEVAGQRHVTIVDGDPSSLAQHNETYYLETALNLIQTSGPTIKIEHRSTQQLSQTPLNHNGLLILANVERLDGGALLNIEHFLAGGGNVLITLGNRIDIEHYNRDWPFLPIRLDRRLGDPARTRSYGLIVEKTDHPLFKSSLDFGATRFFAFIGTDLTTLTESAKIVASFTNGSPAFIESAFSDLQSRGGVMLLTSSIDAYWSNLPYRRVFVPLIDRLVGYLTPQRLVSTSLTLGEPMRFVGPHTLENEHIVVTAPDGTRVTLIATLDETSGRVQVEYRNTNQVGLYRVEADRRFSPHAQDFAVNLDRRESNLTTIDPVAVRDAFGEHPLRIVNHRAAKLGRWFDGDEDQLVAEHTQYWPWLLLLAFGVFILENVLANLFTRRTDIVPPSTTQYLASRRTERSVTAVR